MFAHPLLWAVLLFPLASPGVLFAADENEAITVTVADAAGNESQARLIRIVARNPEEGTISVQPVSREAVLDGDFEHHLGDAGPVFSVRISNPLVASVSFGWVIGDFMMPTNDDSYHMKRLGVLAEAEIGLGGAKGSVGVIAEDFLMIFPVGADLKASVLHTWLLSWGAARDQTYVGGEFDLYFALIKLSFGVFTRIKERDLLISGGLGIGF